MGSPLYHSMPPCPALQASLMKPPHAFLKWLPPIRHLRLAFLQLLLVAENRVQLKLFFSFSFFFHARKKNAMRLCTTAATGSGSRDVGWRTRLLASFKH